MEIESNNSTNFSSILFVREATSVHIDTFLIKNNSYPIMDVEAS